MAVPVDIDARRRELEELFGEDELHPDLVPYVEAHPTFGRVLRHPLVYIMYFHPLEQRRANKMLTAKREHIAQLASERKWNSIMWLYERPYRIDAFVKYAPRMSNRVYWRTLGELWTDCENMHQSYVEWSDALHCGRRERNWLMGPPDDSDRVRWRELRRTSHPLLVYRGWAGRLGRDGFSWTLSQERARWFARRFAGEEHRGAPHVVTGIVDARNVIAYFNARGEEEVVLLPEDVIDVKVVDL